jgi:integrase/recombinase XerD
VPPPHTLRHTFACEYLRRGGNLEFLRRILGHGSILTTQKYLRSLGVEDLQAAHEGLSPLTAERGGRKELAMR